MNLTSIANSVTAALIALVLTVAVVGIVAYEIVNGHAVSIPDLIVAPWLMVVGFYFGGHTAEVSATTAGQTAATVASVTTNGKTS